MQSTAMYFTVMMVRLKKIQLVGGCDFIPTMCGIRNHTDCDIRNVPSMEDKHVHSSLSSMCHDFRLKNPIKCTTPSVITSLFA